MRLTIDEIMREARLGARLEIFGQRRAAGLLPAGTSEYVRLDYATACAAAERLELLAERGNGAKLVYGARS